MSSFVDESQIHVKAGNGGAGSVSFRREAHVAKGGPDGGNGGKGGDVWLVADNNMSSLLAFRDHPHREATSAKHGTSKKANGAGGQDIEVAVPVGTIVKDRSGKVLADLSVPGARWMAAAGGRGGRGNASFLSNRRRAPGWAEQGEVGEEFYYTLELRLIADAAIIGFPNAGKSTLISRISAAKSKVADYPFTTLEPHLGVVRFGEHEFTVADIPGLIEGASLGRGLGLQFLKHVERARVLLVLVDLVDCERSPEDQERILMRELESYNSELVARPRLVVGSKADAVPPAVDWNGPRISAVTGEGLDEMLGGLARIIDDARSALPEPDQFVVHRLVPEGVTVQRNDDGVLVVAGREVQRAVALNDITNDEAFAYMNQRLEKLGVFKALMKGGARAGDRVRIGELTFDYDPDV